MTSPTTTSRPVALVTGASRGIGRAIAEALAPTHDLVLTARDASRLAGTATAASERGATCRTIPLDLRDPAAIAAALAGLEVDVLVNNAGVAVLKPFLELTPEEWQVQVDVNVNALFHVTRAVLPGMVARGRGHLVVIGSLAGRNTFVGGSCYAGTKHFVNGFVESLMLEVRDQGVRSTVIMPGSVDTDLFPPGTDRSWMLEPQDVAEAVREVVAMPSHAVISRLELRPLSPRRPR